MRLSIVLIVVVSALVLIVTVGTIVVGSRSFEGIVVDKPYETGMAWDDARRNRERLGWKVSLQTTTLKTGNNDLIVVVTDRSGAPLTNATITVTASRPSTRAYDRMYETAQLTGGRYQTSIDLPLYGNWEIVIDIRQGGDRAGFRELVYADKEGK